MNKNKIMIFISRGQGRLSKIVETFSFNNKQELINFLAESKEHGRMFHVSRFDTSDHFNAVKKWYELYSEGLTNSDAPVRKDSDRELLDGILEIIKEYGF